MMSERFPMVISQRYRGPFVCSVTARRFTWDGRQHVLYQTRENRGRGGTKLRISMFTECLLSPEEHSSKVPCSVIELSYV